MSVVYRIPIRDVTFSVLLVEAQKSNITLSFAVEYFYFIVYFLLEKPSSALLVGLSLITACSPIQ